MKYKIYCNGILIASFLNESDRDVCLCALEDHYTDSKFSTTLAGKETK
jgi:hypothetical protein